MKRVVSLLLVLMMAVFALAGCGGGGSDSGDGGSGGDSSEPVSVDSLKTMGDILALELEESQWAVYNGKVVYAFKLGDGYYRATGTISEEDAQAFYDIDFSDEDYEAQQEAILGPIAIDNMEDLSDQILTQDEMDALVGKTGQELQDAGWTFSGHDLEEMVFWMNYGPFMYSVYFDGEVAEADYETFEDEAGTKDLTVTKVEFNMLGDATNIE
ncbi:MAG: hypothetical protein IJH91_00290 [Mogibacterium sp.]|nr:hypothetical protein [Mogibacterium sp.]